MYCMQEAMWKVGNTIGDREGRMDVGIAAAGILKPDSPCLTYPAKLFQQVRGRGRCFPRMLRTSVLKPST